MVDQFQNCICQVLDEGNPLVPETTAVIAHGFSQVGIAIGAGVENNSKHFVGTKVHSHLLVPWKAQFPVRNFREWRANG